VEVHISSVVRRMVDLRRLAYRAIAETLPTLGLRVARTEIPMLAAFDHSVVIGTPLIVSDPDGAGAVAYRRLADELSTISRARHLAAVS
jgi:cellulose biosynthesis protein BcsQ